MSMKRIYERVGNLYFATNQSRGENNVVYSTPLPPSYKEDGFTLVQMQSMNPNEVEYTVAVATANANVTASVAPTNMDDYLTIEIGIKNLLDSKFGQFLASKGINKFPIIIGDEAGIVLREKFPDFADAMAEFTGVALQDITPSLFDKLSGGNKSGKHGEDGVTLRIERIISNYTKSCNAQLSKVAAYTPFVLSSCGVTVEDLENSNILNDNDSIKVFQIPQRSMNYGTPKSVPMSSIIYAGGGNQPVFSKAWSKNFTDGISGVLLNATFALVLMIDSSAKDNKITLRLGYIGRASSVLA